MKFSIQWKAVTRLFLNINKEGIFTWVSIAIIIVSAVGYIASIYLVFGLGFNIQNKSEELSHLEAVVTRKELKLHEAQVGLAKGGSELIRSMEKVTSVKYLVPDSFAASDIMGNP